MENYKFNEGYLYKDSFTEKEFKDAVLKYIKDDYLSPSYIFDEMLISEVGRINIPLIQATGEAEIEYSRMLGFDSYVTTTKYKTTTYSNGFQNKTKSSSTKTVTNWQNDSGTLNGTASSGTYDEKYKIYDEYVKDHIMDKNNIRLLTAEELSNCELTSNMIEFLENDILNKVFQNNITYPTNNVKNEEYDGRVKLNNICSTIVSLYSLGIKIRDKELYFIACSNGDIDIKVFGEYPSDNFDEELNFNREITAQRMEATKRPRAIAKYTFLSTIALFILFLVLGISLNVLALTIISFVILVIGLIIGIKYINDVKRISKPFYKQIYDHNHKVFKEHQRIKEEGYQSFINKTNR